MPGLFSQRLLLCPMTVAFCSRWMSGVYENKQQDSFPSVYCYVPWQSQFVLDGCLAFIFIIARTLFPTSTAMSPGSHSLFSMDASLCPLTIAVCSQWMPGVYFHKRQGSFPNIYCYVNWQSQFVLDGCLVFMKINATTLFPTSTAMSLDSRSLSSMDASHLFS